MGLADLLDYIPVAAAGRDVGERTSGAYPDQPALGVELVEQRVEVHLVGAAAVKQDQRTLGIARGLTDTMDQSRIRVVHGASLGERKPLRRRRHGLIPVMAVEPQLVEGARRLEWIRPLAEG